MERVKFSKVVITLYHWILITLAILVYVLPRYLACRCNRNRDVYKDFTNISKKMLVAFGVKYHQVGKISDYSEALIIASNHTSLLDIFIFGVFFDGRPGVVFIDRKLLKWPIVGFFLKRMNAIAFRVKTGEGSKEAFEKAKSVLKNKSQLLIFPEETRTIDGKLLPFKNGTAVLAMRTNTNILPIGLAGSFEVSNKSTWLISPGKVVLYTGEAICPKVLSIKEFNAILQNSIENCIKKANEIRDNIAYK